ncbi:MAG: hypothetical protein MUP92_04160 [Actinobacteria bacterium]|nr:hypothetical protein [Actinomycetota bacterium]
MSARRTYFRLPDDWAQMSDAEKTAWAGEVAGEILEHRLGQRTDEADQRAEGEVAEGDR